MTQELAAPEGGALTEVEEQALAQQATAGLNDDRLTLPMLKLTQQMTGEVADEGIESGHYINSLTGTDYGETAGLVIVWGPVKGRFLSVRRTGDVFVAVGDVVPPNWPEKYAGKRFDELPDAEETYKELANQPGGEWGSGPPIQTTRNYIGYLTEDPEIPVRLSFKSTGTQAAEKINSLLRWTLKAPWHNVIDLASKRKTDAQDNPYWVPTAQLGRETSADERQRAVTLSHLVAANLDNLRLVGDSPDEGRPGADKPATPAGEDSIDVA